MRLNVVSVEHNVESDSRIVRILSELGHRILQLGEPSRRNCPGDMACVSGLAGGGVRQRDENRTVA